MEKSSFSLDLVSFNDIYANNGGVFYVYRQSPFYASNLTVNSINALAYGGVGFFTQAPSPTGTYSISFFTSYFQNITSGSRGGAFYLDSNYIAGMILHQVQFYNVSTGDEGGVFFVNRIGGQLQVTADTQNTFSNFYAST